MDILAEFISQEFPLCLVDVGSRGGLPPRWKRLSPYLHWIGFEPDKRSFERLKKKPSGQRVTLLPHALYKEKARLNLYLTREPGDSSILEPNRALLGEFPESERYDVETIEVLDVDTLDSQLAAIHQPEVDFIKLDTQGSELYILQGASTTLSRGVFGVEIEVEFIPLYVGQPLFADVDSFMRKMGFQLFELCPIYWQRRTKVEHDRRKGQLIYADALYFRELNSFANLLDQLNQAQRKGKLLKSLAILALYGYLDYCLAILERWGDEFEEGERRMLMTKLQMERRAPLNLPDFPGRQKIARWVYHLWETLASRGHSWRSVGSGVELGNRS